MLSTEFGTIYMWAGSIASIPPGYILCDGNNGTPNLQDKFIAGAGDSFAVDSTGGVSIHNHPFTGDGHQHAISAIGDIADGDEIDPITASSQATGTTDNTNQKPPFYALAYLMKIT